MNNFSIGKDCQKSFHCAFSLKFSMVALQNVRFFFQNFTFSIKVSHFFQKKNTVVQPVKDKKYVNFTFSTIFITTFSFYSLLGITLGLYYGKSIKPACSLNFAYYRGGASFDEEIPFFAIFVQYLIVLFPAFDVVSAFPLNAITLADSLYAAVFPHTNLEEVEGKPEEKEEDEEKEEILDEEREVSQKYHTAEEEEEKKSILGAEKEGDEGHEHELVQSFPEIPHQKKAITVIDGKKKRVVKQKETSMDTLKKLMKTVASKMSRTSFRLVATIPPLIGAAIVRDLEKSSFCFRCFFNIFLNFFFFDLKKFFVLLVCLVW